MKAQLILFSFLMAGILVAAGCNNPKQKAVNNTQDPIFQSDPNLKKITDQITGSPKDAALYFERGNLLHRMRLDTLAIKDFKIAATIDTTRADYYSAIGDLLFENKDIKGSVEWIQKAIALDPKDVKSHLKIAKLFLYMREYPKAMSEIDDKVLRKDVYNPEAYFLKGMIYKEMKDTARAISNFLTSVQMAPDYRESVIQLGLLYSAKNDPIALKYLDNAYRIDSTDVFPLFAEGVYYQNKNDFENAKEIYRKCITRNAHYVDAFFNMGYVLMQQDSVEKAYRQYDIATKIDPANPTAYYDRGVCSEQMKKIPEAITDYKQAALLDTAYKSPREALSRLKVKL